LSFHCTLNVNRWTPNLTDLPAKIKHFTSYSVFFKSKSSEKDDFFQKGDNLDAFSAQKSLFFEKNVVFFQFSFLPNSN